MFKNHQVLASHLEIFSTKQHHLCHPRVARLFWLKDDAVWLNSKCINKPNARVNARNPNLPETRDQTNIQSLTLICCRHKHTIIIYS